MTKREPPHPDNAPGPFYVEYGCCTACGVPESIAPELFAWDGDDHCFVKRQPATPAEIDQTLEVLDTAELSCIRYRGLDQDLLARIAELGQPELCDFGARLDLKPVLRDHVAFADPLKAALSPADLASQFREFLAVHERYRVTEISSSPELASFEVAWFENDFHRVVASHASGAAQSWLVRHHGNRGVSSLVQQWLVADGRFSDVRWYSEQSWSEGKWRRTPW